MDSLNCNICTEKFNRSTRNEIKCEYCDFTSCRTCFETYLLSQSTPHCMKPQSECGKIWTRKFLANNFTITFITKKYKLHQERILFEKELALMPQTQLIIERQHHKENKIKQYVNEIHTINDMINELIYNRANLENLIRRINVGDINDENDENDDGQESKKEREIKFSFRCTNENCRGFLSSRWKCQLCETWTCPDCRINIGSNENKVSHVCNNDDLETAKLLKKDSKPCPKCGIVIFKISGCDQMFCTQCHTPFSWKTGEIVTRGNIHNPHYFEYMRNQEGDVPRNPLDIQCGRLLDMIFINVISSLLVYLACNFTIDERTNNILRICRHISHLDIEIMRIRDHINQYDDITQRDRIKYLKNLITEEEFKRIVQVNEKKYQKFQEMMNLLVMVRDTGTDILYICGDKLRKIDDELKINLNKSKYLIFSNDLLHRTNKPHQRTYNYLLDDSTKLKIKELLEVNDVSTDKVLNEFENLRTYANDCLIDISKTFHTSLPKYFDEKFNLVNKPKTQKRESKEPENKEPENKEPENKEPENKECQLKTVPDDETDDEDEIHFVRK